MRNGRTAPPNPDGPGVAAAIRQGEPKALRAVVETYLPRVLRTARCAGLAPAEAEAVTRETFTTFLDVASRFEGRALVRTFLFSILCRKLAELRPELAREPHDPIGDVVESRFTPKGTWSRPPRASRRMLRPSEVRRALEACFAAAPAVQRLAFCFREVEGLSLSDIAKVLDVGATNVGVMLYRLRNRSREYLEGQEVAA